MPTPVPNELGVGIDSSFRVLRRFLPSSENDDYARFSMSSRHAL